MNQAIIVYSDKNQFKALTRITHELVHESPEACVTLQAAIDAVGSSGGQVMLEQGIYPLSRPIELRHRVRLTGAGRGTRLVAAGEAGIVLRALDGAEVADLAVVAAEGSSAETGVLLDGCGDCQVTNVFAGGFAHHGFRLWNHSFLCTLRGCSATGNDRSNIYLDTLAMSGRGGRYLPNLVTDCMVYGGGKGIEAHRAIVANIVGCCIFQTRDPGFHIHTGSNSVAVTGCRTFQVGRNAVLLEDSDEVNLSGNIFCWHVEDGIVVRNAHWGAITGNEVIDSGSYNSGVEDRTATWADLPKDLPPYCGIRLYGVKGYNVSGNTVFNWGVCPPMEYGIFEDEKSFKNNLVANSINLFVKEGVYSKGAESSATNNVCHATRPYQDRAGLQHWFQTFRTDLRDKFIADQLASEVRQSVAPARSFEDSFLTPKR